MPLHRGRGQAAALTAALTGPAPKEDEPRHAVDQAEAVPEEDGPDPSSDQREAIARP